MSIVSTVDVDNVAIDLPYLACLATCIRFSNMLCLHTNLPAALQLTGQDPGRFEDPDEDEDEEGQQIHTPAASS